MDKSTPHSATTQTTQTTKTGKTGNARGTGDTSYSQNSKSKTKRVEFSLPVQPATAIASDSRSSGSSGHGKDADREMREKKAKTEKKVDLQQEDLTSHEFGEYVSSRYVPSNPLESHSTSINLDDSVLRNIRDEFYLKIITSETGRSQLLRRMSALIGGLEASGTLTRYTPTADNPIYIFKNGQHVKTVTESLITVGTLEWNTFIGVHALGVSRIHAIIVFMKNASGNIVMFVIDGWSLGGTVVLDKNNRHLYESQGNSRSVLVSDLTACARIMFSRDVFTFSTSEGKDCTICMDKLREARLKCGHGTMCADCAKKVDVCPICREPVNKKEVLMSMCMNSYGVDTSDDR